MHAEARSWHRWPPYMLRQSFSLTLEVPNSVHLAIWLALDALCLLSSQIAGRLGWGYKLWPSCIWGKLFICWVISPGQDIQFLKHFTSPNSWESGSKGKKYHCLTTKGSQAILFLVTPNQVILFYLGVGRGKQLLLPWNLHFKISLVEGWQAVNITRKNRNSMQTTQLEDWSPTILTYCLAENTKYEF